MSKIQKLATLGTKETKNGTKIIFQIIQKKEVGSLNEFKEIERVFGIGEGNFKKAFDLFKTELEKMDISHFQVGARWSLSEKNLKQTPVSEHIVYYVQNFFEKKKLLAL